MAHRDAARTVLGPTRRRALAAALTLYTEDQLFLALDGVVIDAYWSEHRCDFERAFMRDGLLNEGRVEDFIEAGEKLRLMADRADARAAEPQARPVSDPAAGQAARERMRRVADELRARSGGRS